MTQEDFYTIQICTGYIARLAGSLERYHSGEQTDNMRLNTIKKQYEDARRQSNNKPKDQIKKIEADSLENAYKEMQAKVNDNTTEREKDVAEIESRMQAFKQVELEILSKNFPKECLPKES